MKRFFLCLIFVCFLFQREAKGQVFRGFDWNTSKAKVILKEGKPYHNENNPLTYFNRTVSYCSAVAKFYFEDNKLKCGIYMITPNGANSWDRILQGLKSKYGQPKLTIIPTDTFYGVKRNVKRYKWFYKNSDIILYDSDPSNYILEYNEHEYYQRLVRLNDKMTRDKNREGL